MDLSYPIGRFTWTGPNTSEQCQRLINDIAAAPENLRRAAGGLSSDQLDTPYRPAGWTVRQVVHHLPDSHMNGFTRFKLALTEDTPTIKPYDESRWAELADATKTPTEVSLALLESLHYRWVTLLRSLSAEDYQRKYQHPELGLMTLDKTLALYAWHGAHHVAHITSLRERLGWK
jgi:uncharacterized damage-inducible protein DinB